MNKVFTFILLIGLAMSCGCAKKNSTQDWLMLGGAGAGAAGGAYAVSQVTKNPILIVGGAAVGGISGGAIAYFVGNQTILEGK